MMTTQSLRAARTAPPQPADLPKALMHLIAGSWLSRAVCVAAKIGIADRLEGGPKRIDVLAREAGVCSDSLERLLRALAAHGIFRESDMRRWELTPLANLLRSTAPGSLHPFACFVGDAHHYDAWGALEYSVRCGDEAYRHVHDESLWQTLQRLPSFAQTFNDAMTGVARQLHSAFVEAYDFSRFERLVDVGGGHGELMFRLLERYPDLRGVVFDLPAVIEGTQRRIAELGLTGRCEAVGGDFFEGVPQGADAYVLTHVIHDWSDELAFAILHNVRAAMRHDSVLLLGEHVLAPGNDADFAKLLDLEMLVLTQGGRERTAGEFGGILSAAGLTLARIVDTPSGTKVLEAVVTP